MYKVIKNAEQLLSTGDQESRTVVLDILDHTLERLDSYNRIKSMVKVEGNIMTIGEKSWDLSKKRNIYLIGAGKAANAMARAFDEILGDWITDGIAVVKIREPKDDDIKHIRIYTGGHPLPNQSGYLAALKVLEMVEQATEEDLFIGAMSGIALSFSGIITAIAVSLIF